MRSVKCKFDLFVDDVLIEQFRPKTDEFGRGINGETYINPTILNNGLHTFKGILYPWHDKKVVDNIAHLELKTYILDTDNFPKQVDLVTIKTPWKKLENDISLPFYELTGEFKATMLPFELAGWRGSVNLAEGDRSQLFHQVLTYYRQLHAILKQRDAVKWEQLHAEKEALIAKAFYYDYRLNELKDPVFKAMMDDRKQATAELFSEEGLQLAPLQPHNLRLLLQAGGRLVSLVRPDNTPALRFADPKNEGEVQMEVRLHRKQPRTALSII